jgi:hypothetical protein
MAAVAGLVPCAESGMRIFLRGLPCDSCHARDQQDAGELAVRAGGRLQRDRVHAGDFEQAALQQVEDLEDALRQRSGR